MKSPIACGARFLFLAILVSPALIVLAPATVDAQVKPLAQLQADYVKLGFGMFLHYNMSTYARCCCAGCVSVQGEWENGNENENLFNPGHLDCGQWARAAKAAGMKYMILVVKHHGGFCLWNSAQTTHDVGNSSWRGGKGDVVRDFVDSARAYGIKVGLYFSIWERLNQPATAYIKAQLTELLTNYGEITCLWFDGWGWQVGYVTVPYDSIKSCVKSIQPNCLIIENNHYQSLQNTEIMEYEEPVEGLPPAGNTTPGEGCVPLVNNPETWFWHPTIQCAMYPAATVAADVKNLGQRTSTYLLDVTVDTSGAIPECQVQRLKEIGVILGVPQNPVRHEITAASAARAMTITRSPGGLTVSLAPHHSLRDLSIYNTRGMKVFCHSVITAPAAASVDLSALSRGTYLAAVETEEGRGAAQFTIDR